MIDQINSYYDIERTRIKRIEIIILQHQNNMCSSANPIALIVPILELIINVRVTSTIYHGRFFKATV